MNRARAQPRRYRFGPFELDSGTEELRRGDTRLRIGGHAFQILMMLVERRGEVVFRDQIQLRLWPNDTIVEFDQGINTAVRQLRNALRDTAKKPRYIETVARRGYRFLVDVEADPQGERAASVETGALTGRTLSHFKIGQQLGAGGMGIVYRAEDLQLGRQVALKFLRRPVGELPRPVRARFEREARAAALLHHPNICSVFALESLGGQPVIVMEFIDGETLAARLTRGPMSLAEALPVAAQVAGALDAAHQNGLAHRDLKPANIMLTQSGVKLLDFGLVKAEPGGPPDIATGKEAGAAVSGTILGTPYYMSPEQAQGKETDWRTDIFSFGLVLFEMLSGHKAFDVENPAGAIDASLEFDPPGLSEIGPDSLRQLVRRCLARNPEERRQSAGDLKANLELLMNSRTTDSPAAEVGGEFVDGRGPRAAGAPAGPAAETPIAGAPQAVSTNPAARGPRPKILVGAGVLAGALAAFAIAAIWLRGKPAETPVVRLKVDSPGNEIHLNFGAGSGVALSPDGRRVVFSAFGADGVNRLWVRTLDTLEAQPVAGTEDARYPFWSPDSRFIGFNSQGKLKKIDPNGGPPLTITDAIFLRGASWNRDGVIVFAPNNSGPLRRVQADGGALAAVTTLANTEHAHRAPWFLPDGRHFLYSPTEGAPSSPVRVGSLDSPPHALDITLPIVADSNVIYAAGYLLFLRKSVLTAQPFDPARLQITGEAVTVAERVRNRTSSAVGLFSASENGMLVYAPGDEHIRSLTWFDRKSNRLASVGDPNSFRGLRLSPDGKNVAVTIGEGYTRDIWIYGLPRGLRTRLTFDQRFAQSPVWSPDRRSIVWGSVRHHHIDLYRKSSDGAGAEEVLYADTLDKVPNSWSNDGRFLFYTANDPKTGADIWVLPMQPNGEKPYPWLRTNFNESGAQISSDGRRVLYSSNESGRSEVYVASFPGPGGKRQVSTTGGGQAQWRADGKEIFFLGSDWRIRAVEVTVNGAALELGETHPLMDSPVHETGEKYAVSADGRLFLIEVPPEGNKELTVVQNWTATLKK